MAHLTLIARASDGLPLSASIVNEEVRRGRLWTSAVSGSNTKYVCLASYCITK